jgi:histidyl-tRNA synthetase
MKLERAKGVRDFAPEEKIVRQEIVEQIRQIFELYGFSPLETPILERLDVLSAKYAGGADILKETFKLKDQGGRELGLRYDLTVPLARFIGMNPGIKMPFKRYQIGSVFRDGPIKLGRYREFWQCDVDVVGVDSMKADAEIVSLTQDVFSKLGLDIVIKINNRKILDSILDEVGVKKEKRTSAILAIDKLEKFGAAEVKEELKAAKLSDFGIKKLMKLLSIKDISKLKEQLKDMQGINEINELMGYIGKTDVEFTPSLARGLSYYTGTIFEVFLKKSKITSAVAAGGRYDEMIGKFIGPQRIIPAVGIAFGLDVIMDAVQLKQKPGQKTVTKVYIIPIQTFKESFRIAQQLRNEGIKTDIDLSGRGPSKNLNYANAMNIPYVIFIGEEELKQQKVKLKDMKSGKEELLDISRLLKVLK